MDGMTDREGLIQKIGRLHAVVSSHEDAARHFAGTPHGDYCEERARDARASMRATQRAVHEMELKNMLAAAASVEDIKAVKRVQKLVEAAYDDLSGNLTTKLAKARALLPATVMDKYGS